GVQVDGLVQSLFAREALGRRLGRRQPRSGRRERGVSPRVLRPRRTAPAPVRRLLLRARAAGDHADRHVHRDAELRHRTIHVRVEWSWDQGSWSNESQIGRFPPTDADGAFSGTMVFHGIVDHTEYIRAHFAATANYLASTSPVVAQAIQLAAVPPPPASFSVDFTFAPSSPVVGQIVTFTATTVDGTAPFTSSWNFGDGTTAAGSAATHGYPVAGTYTVQVTASDSAAHTATKSKSVVATASAPPPPPGGPVAQFAFTPTSPQVDAMVTFDASASTSSNGVLEARWDWEEDGVWDTAWSTTLGASHAFSATGTYSIRLSVRDAGGLSDFIARSVIVIGSQGGGTPGAPTSFGFLGPLEGNPLTIPALGLVFLLFGVAAIRHRLVRTE